MTPPDKRWSAFRRCTLGGFVWWPDPGLRARALHPGYGAAWWKKYLDIVAKDSYIGASMITQTQDTHPQDPIDRFTLRIEGLRRMPVPRGVAGVVHLMFVEFFVALWTALARFAEQRRNGTLAVPAPVVAPDQSRTWPAEPRPRESGGVEQRSAEAPRDCGTSRAPLEQPEIKQPIAAREVPGVEPPAVLARPQHVDDGCWPRWRGAGLRWTGTARFLRLDSNKSGLAGGVTCAHFVTN